MLTHSGIERTTVLRRPALRQAIDLVIAVSVAAVTVSFARQYHPDGWPRFDRWAVLLSLTVSLPLALRRRVPWVVLLVSSTALTAYTAAGYQPSVNVWGPVLALYTLATGQPLRRAAPGVLLAGGVVEYATIAARVVDGWVATGQTLVVIGLAWAFGANVRRVRERNDQLTELTRRLRVEQAARARHAVTEERLRIARELHDVVAHHLSVISIQSGLARYVFDSAPDTARTALDTVADTAHRSLEEMRGLLHLLRVPPDGDAPSSESSGDAPATGLARLPELAERVTVSGVPVEIGTTGTVRPLPPGADLCAYRIVQEALTNTLKHAAPTRATVSLAYSADHLTIRVTDNGPSDATASPTARVPGSGQGLIGMRERATLYGGTFTAGPREGGAAGYEVRFTLPLGPAGEK
ncbi:sensor histidine kinase [Streptomyces sp. NPDC049577]|uniref:sensor histidine kinase n=1 Tax=Streptomyces sp. NPDC049577 TaxID=3155153 RepID=UPI00341CD55C